MTGSSEKITFDYKLTLGLIAIVTMILYFWWSAIYQLCFALLALWLIFWLWL
jgi:hypothetical protein